MRIDATKLLEGLSQRVQYLEQRIGNKYASPIRDPLALFERTADIIRYETYTSVIAEITQAICHETISPAKQG